MGSRTDPARPPAGLPAGTRRAAGFVVAIGLVLSGGLLSVPGVLPGVLAGPRSRLPWFPSGNCPVTDVDVVVAPVIEEAVTQAVSAVQGSRLPDGRCVQVRVRPQAPDDTVAMSTVVTPERAPQLWVSDSSLWAGQIRGWPLTTDGYFASTPVVLASSPARVAAAGWTAAPPSWTVALDGTRPFANPGLAGSAPGLLTMQALWQAGGQGASAQRRLAAAMLAASRYRGTGQAEALNEASQGGPAALLVPSTEQEVLSVNQDAPTPRLAAVYPAEGSPVLDFPVLRPSANVRTPSQRTAADVVVSALLGPGGRQAARAAGFRDPAGGSPPDGVDRAAVAQIRPLAPVVQAGFLARLLSLSAPSRILAVVDVSPSMRAQVGATGLTRLEVAGRAAAGAGSMLADTSSVGLWVFSSRLDGARPYRSLSPIARLGDRDGPVTHREAVVSRLATLDRHVSGGGTALYVTALEAVRATREGYDPQAVNTVVLFTDGKNENADSLSLQGLLQRLRAEKTAAPRQPVRIVGIAIGPEADLAGLQAMAAVTGGAAYRATTPDQVVQVLYDALSQRDDRPDSGAAPRGR